MSDVTRLLDAAAAGDSQAAADLLPLVYDELRRLAADYLARERPGQTFQATALVHEAYVRLVASGGGHAPGNAQDRGVDTPRSPTFANRGHFFGAAARAMRQILVDAARRKAADKRGGDRERVPLDAAVSVAAPDGPPADDLIALDDALTRLAAEDPVKARLVELRYFAGLSVEDAAAALGVSPATAKRYWVYARSWLYGELSGE
ncbi:MAG: sigma-70 family RNA polymerase sigma factor [Gemmataceae bacterium]